MSVFLAGCGNALSTTARAAPAVSPLVVKLATPVPDPPLVDAGLDLRAGPVDVPLQLRIPSLGINAPVLAVGIDAKNVMDTPAGSANDPLWQKVFWYRGGAIPGEPSTATIAGHVDDVLGRPAIFARLKDLRPGNEVAVRDTRTGHEVAFVVSRTVAYTLPQTRDRAVLEQIYGDGPVLGQGPEPSDDGLAHLTLITCTGHWLGKSGTYDQRLVVYLVGLKKPVTRHPSIAG